MSKAVSSDQASKPSLPHRLQGKLARLSSIFPEAWLHRIAHTLKFDNTHDDLDPQIRLLLAVRAARGEKDIFTHNVAGDRDKLRQEMASLRKQPTPLQAVTDLRIPTSYGSIAARRYQPNQEDPQLPLVMFIHGGGFVIGDLDTHDEACRMLARYGRFQVIAIDYRLAPEHRAPAAVEDAIDAMKWLQANAAQFGKQRGQIAVAGDSAGGNLTAVVCQQLAGTADMPCAQMLIYPVMDVAGDYKSRELFGKNLILNQDDFRNFRDAYLADQNLHDDPRISPMRGRVDGLPPALVITGAFDMLRDEGETYARKLKAAGVPVVVRRVAGHGHGFMNLTPINESAKWATIQSAQDFAMLCRGEL